MLSLCMNRFPLPGSPSTCALDTGVMPLPSFLLIVSLQVLAYFIFRGKRRDTRRTNSILRLSAPRWLHITYSLLALAALGMNIVEVTRLAIDKQGVGLLPVTVIGLLITDILLWTSRGSLTRPLSIILCVYWLLLLAFESLKVSRLNTLDLLDPAKQSMYKTSDRVLDNAVMLGLYVIFFCIEVLRLVGFLGRRRSDVDDADSKVELT